MYVCMTVYGVCAVEIELQRVVSITWTFILIVNLETIEWNGGVIIKMTKITPQPSTRFCKS